jgi:hypothetical protein
LYSSSKRSFEIKNFVALRHCVAQFQTLSACCEQSHRCSQETPDGAQLFTRWQFRYVAAAQRSRSAKKFKSTNMQDGIVQIPRIETAFCERYSYFCAMMQEVNKIRLLVVEEPLSVFVIAAARRPGRGF